MQVYLNGHFVSEEHAAVSIFDRGFLYGDGLFETLRVCRGIPFRWQQHWMRLERGAEFLHIPLATTGDSLRAAARELVTRNEMPESLLRVAISRGSGARGYSPKGATQPTIALSLHAAPPFDLANPVRWKLITSSLRLPAHEPLARFKTANKLPQICARAEADAAGADEALLLNTEGNVIEAASSNLFWIENGAVCTAPIESGVLPGVTRDVVLEICRKLAIAAREKSIRPDALRAASGVFLSLSSLGIVEAISLDGNPLPLSPLSSQIRNAYWELVKGETLSRPA